MAKSSGVAADIMRPVASAGPIRRVSYNEKPYAVRVKAPPGTPQARIGAIKLTHVLVGEEPVEYNGVSHKATLSGTEFDAWDWLELRHRVDELFIRDGRLEKVSPPKGEWDSASSRFLTRNWRAIVKQRVGTMKRSPWWLRWLYSAVITKEDHGFGS